jgi:hypothetical protein
MKNIAVFSGSNTTVDFLDPHVSVGHDQHGSRHASAQDIRKSIMACYSALDTLVKLLYSPQHDQYHSAAAFPRRPAWGTPCISLSRYHAQAIIAGNYNPSRIAVGCWSLLDTYHRRLAAGVLLRHRRNFTHITRHLVIPLRVATASFRGRVQNNPGKLGISCSPTTLRAAMSKLIISRLLGLMQALMQRTSKR